MRCAASRDGLAPRRWAHKRTLEHCARSLLLLPCSSVPADALGSPGRTLLPVQNLATVSLDEREGTWLRQTVHAWRSAIDQDRGCNERLRGSTRQGILRAKGGNLAHVD